MRITVTMAIMVIFAGVSYCSWAAPTGCQFALEFYRGYLTRLDANEKSGTLADTKGNFVRAMHAFLTSGCANATWKSSEGDNGDAIICGQDWSPDWKRYLSAVEVRTTPQRSICRINIDPRPGWNQVVTVTLVPTDTGFLIDKIRCPH